MSRLADFMSALDSTAPGWRKERYLAAMADTKACADQARGQKNPIQRMVTFIECRRGKRLPIGA